jgi:hypothetical protein
MEGSGSLPIRQALAKRIMGSVYSLDHKAQLVQHIAEGKPPIYVEAQLDQLTLFLGFAPDPSIELKQFILPGGARVFPRTEPVPFEKVERYVNVLRQLKSAAYSNSTLFRAFVRYKTEWVDKVCQVTWYNWFDDEVCLCVAPPDGYKFINRKELLNGLEQPRGIVETGESKEGSS